MLRGESVYWDNHYDEIIKKQLNDAFKNLGVVTGYVSPYMVDKVLSADPELKLLLIIGMTSKEGIEKKTHERLLKLIEREGHRFECYYVAKGAPVHSKCYLWYGSRDGDDIAYMGSANFSNNGLLGNRELMCRVDPSMMNNYFVSISHDVIDIRDQDISRKVLIFKKKKVRIEEVSTNDELQAMRSFELARRPKRNIKPNLDRQTIEYEHTDIRETTISLLDSKEYKKGNLVTPDKSGINWGQRENRNRDQAYLAINGEIRKTDFFPTDDSPFAMITDDGNVLSCARVAGVYGKQIQTYVDNSELGAYLRARLGLPSGTYVTYEHLKEYGRTDIRIEKIDDRTFYLDFSV